MLLSDQLCELEPPDGEARRFFQQLDPSELLQEDQTGPPAPSSGEGADWLAGLGPRSAARRGAFDDDAEEEDDMDLDFDEMDEQEESADEENAAEGDEEFDEDEDDDLDEFDDDLDDDE